MFYYLAQYKILFSALNVFQYITFRAGGAFLTALGLCLVFGEPFVQGLKKLKMQQSIREYGPKTHLAKSGTPTMGGLLMLAAVAASTVLWARWDNSFVWLALFTSSFLGALGFVDDYRKWLKKHPAGGLNETVKMGFQLALALGVSYYIYVHPPNAAFTERVNVPYLKDVFIPLSHAYVFFILCVLVGSSNAVNLTDGLDGLAAGVLIVNAITFAVFAYLVGNVRFADYLRIIHVPGAGELTVFLASMAGACLGFLWFNGYPAQIFMGDTGSLFLGGSLGLVALLIKQELILVIVGGIFVAEALSVILQVGSVRFRKGKRIFKMAPLHHHFEELGWPETKVTIRFWIVAIVLSLLALASLKIR